MLTMKRKKGERFQKEEEEKERGPCRMVDGENRNVFFFDIIRETKKDKEKGFFFCLLAQGQVMVMRVLLPVPPVPVAWQEDS